MNLPLLAGVLIALLTIGIMMLLWIAVTTATENEELKKKLKDMRDKKQP